MAPCDPSWTKSKAKEVLYEGLKSGEVKDHWKVKELVAWNGEMFGPFAKNKRLATNLLSNWLRLKKTVDALQSTATADKLRVQSFKNIMGVKTHDTKGNLLWTQAARKQMKLDMADENKKKMHPDTLKATSNVYALYDRRMIRRKMEQEIFQHKSTNYWNEKKQEIEKNKKIYK